MLDDAVVTPLGLVSKLAELIKIGNTESLTDLVRMTRVEPIVLLDEQVPNYPYIEDVLKSTLSIFAGLYLQGLAVTVNVGKINVMKVLDRLSPNRRPIDSLAFATESLLNANNYKFGLPKFEIALESGVPVPQVKDIPMTSVQRIERPGEPEAETNSGVRLGKDTLTIVRDAANLSVGMLFEADIESEGQKATIPITLRFITNIMENEVLTHILSHAEKKTTFKERYHGWRSGELELINDIVLCGDLIKAHRKTLMKDKSGVYREIMSRKNRNRLSGMLSMNPSVATASNIAIISDTTANAVETEMGGRLSNFALRERMFHKTLMMIMMVIDNRYEQVTIYYRGIQLPTQVSVKGMKAASKSGGMDVAEVLRAFQLGTSPRF